MQTPVDAWRAIHLLSAQPRLPTHTLMTAVASLDGQRHLSARGLIRMERLLALVPPAPTLALEAFDWLQQLEILASIIQLQEQRRGTAHAEHAAAGLQRVRQRLQQLVAVAEAAGVQEPTNGNSRELLENVRGRPWADPTRDLQGLVREASEQTGLSRLIAITLGVAREQLRTVDVLIPLLRAEHAIRQGWLDKAERWLDLALDNARQPGAALLWEPTVLGTADRREEARQRLRIVESQLSPDLLAILALRLGEPDLGQRAFEATGVDPARTPVWNDILTGAELALARGHDGRALDLARRGIALFEDALGHLLRDTDRVAACDDASASALFQTAAKAAISVADRTPERRAELLATSFELSERGRSLAIDPLMMDVDRAPERQAWRCAAAEWAASVDRALATIDSPDAGNTAPLLESIDAAERRLHQLEWQLETEAPGTLAARLRPRQRGD